MIKGTSIDRLSLSRRKLDERPAMGDEDAPTDPGGRLP
jgi:hypothetical protein